MKNLLFIVVLSMVGLQIGPENQILTKKESQKIKHAPQFTFCQGQDSLLSFSYSTKPVTNRDYITYLTWVKSVYVCYPYRIMEDFPAREFWGYIFNPQFIDYPIVGLSWAQASRFATWLSDRYNEYTLIKKKHIELNLIQVDDCNWTTETYLTRRYACTWITRNGEAKYNSWDEKEFVPLFRLPTAAEAAMFNPKHTIKMQSYKIFPFIKPWHPHKYGTEFFLEMVEDSLSHHSIEMYGPIVEYAQNEITLDGSLNEKPHNIYEVYKKIGKDRVHHENNDDWYSDELGRAPYRILGEDSTGKLYTIDSDQRYPERELNTPQRAVFRVAVNAIKAK